MDSKTTTYLLDQQRMAFKQNWEDEFDNWSQDWQDDICLDLHQLKNANELENYLYKRIHKDSYTDEEYIYHNFINQTKEDRDYMFDYIIKQVAGILEDERRYGGGDF
jgi:hypothetical protein